MRKARKAKREPLSRDVVVRAAMEIADADGIAAVTMRRIGQTLGVEAMSLYYHVAGKDDVIEGIVDTFAGELGAPIAAPDWKASIRARAMIAREFVRRHPWVPRLMLARPGGVSPAMMRYYDALIGDLLRGRFSHQLAHTAMHILGSRTLGFTQDIVTGDEAPEFARKMLSQIRLADYPNIAEGLKGVHHDEDVEFEFGLDLILDGLERARDAEARRELSASSCVSLRRRAR